MTDVPIRGSLSRLPSGPTSPEEIEAMRVKAWRDEGIAVIRPEEVRDELIRQAIVNEANRRFGRRPKGMRG